MVFGLSSACFYPLDTLSTFNIIGETGFSLAEIFVNAPSEYSSSGIREIIEKKNYYGIDIYSYHPFTSFSEPYIFFSGYKKRVEDGIDDYKYQFEAAKKMGAKVFSFHGDFKGGYETTPAQYADLYNKLYEAAKEQDIIFAQENVQRCKCGYPEYLKELKKELGNEISFTLDVKQAGRAGVSVFELIDIMDGNIVNFHISDSDISHDCLLPFEGTAPLTDIISRVEKHYSGPAIIEVYSNNYSSLNEFRNLKEKLKT